MSKDISSKQDGYEMVDHPNHYNRYSVEVFEMILKIFGPYAASKWAEISGFRYRQRMGTKPNNPLEQDIKKETVYLDKYKEYTKLWKEDPNLLDKLPKDEIEYVEHVHDLIMKKATESVNINPYDAPCPDIHLVDCPWADNIDMFKVHFDDLSRYETKLNVATPYSFTTNSTDSEKYCTIVTGKEKELLKD